MLVPLDKLLAYDQNKYILTKAAMLAVDKIPNMENYPEKIQSWQVVPNILKLVLNEDVKFETKKEEDQEK